MTDGAEIRRAFDGPDIEHDQLIGRASRHNMEDSERASTAAETRSDIGTFVEATGVNKKAYSWLRQILKTGDKSQDKAMDVIRSLEKCLPMVKSHIGGQTTMDMNLTPEEVAKAEAGPEPQPERQVSDEEAEFNAEVDDVVKPLDFGAKRG